MFQNINIETEEIQENETPKNVNKLELLKENFTLEKIILYILAYGVSRNKL